MTKQLPQNALEWGLLILQNAPAGINTLKELKALFTEFYTDVRETHDGDTSLDELRQGIQSRLDKIASNSEDIQKG